MKTRKMILGLLTITGLLITGCNSNGVTDGRLTASGTISAVSVNIAPEIGGKVVAINFQDGDTVKANDVLFEVDSEYIQSQLDQANAAVESAEAALETAEMQARTARLQLELAKQSSRSAFSKDRG